MLFRHLVTAAGFLAVQASVLPRLHVDPGFNPLEMLKGTPSDNPTDKPNPCCDQLRTVGKQFPEMALAICPLLGKTPKPPAQTYTPTVPIDHPGYPTAPPEKPTATTDRGYNTTTRGYGLQEDWEPVYQPTDTSATITTTTKASYDDYNTTTWTSGYYTSTATVPPPVPYTAGTGLPLPRWIKDPTPIPPPAPTSTETAMPTATANPSDEEAGMDSLLDSCKKMNVETACSCMMGPIDWPEDVDELEG